MGDREGSKTTEIPRHPASLDGLHAEIALRFGRPEVRNRARRSLDRLLSQVARKNGRQLAETLGQRRPDGVQRLLNAACWDAEAVRDDLQRYVVTQLGNAAAVLVIDETGFLTKGTESTGGARQSCRTAGRIENCQIDGFPGYATPHGMAFFDRALYLPKVWTAGATRRQAADIPETVEFATRGDLARVMLARGFSAAVPARGVVADEVSGNDGAFHRWLQELRAYVLGVARSHMIWVEGTWTQQGAGRRSTRCRKMPGSGCRSETGARDRAWTIGWRSASPQGWVQGVLPRRSLAAPNERAYDRVFAPEETTVAGLARVAGIRWAIEIGFERANGGVSPDEYDVGMGRLVPPHFACPAGKCLSRGDAVGGER